MTFVASIVVAGVEVNGVLRGSADASNGAKIDVSDATTCKPVSVAPCCTLVRYSKGFMPRVTRGGFVLLDPPESDQTGQSL